MKYQLDAHHEDRGPAIWVFIAFQYFQETPSKQARELVVQKDLTDRANASPFPLLQNFSISRHQPKPTCLQDLL